jgi:anion-transporting  ArsA/GET3 family ATPase
MMLLLVLSNSVGTSLPSDLAVTLVGGTTMAAAAAVMAAAVMLLDTTGGLVDPKLRLLSLLEKELVGLGGAGGGVVVDAVALGPKASARRAA